VGCATHGGYVLLVLLTILVESGTYDPWHGTHCMRESSNALCSNDVYQNKAGRQKRFMKRPEGSPVSIPPEPQQNARAACRRRTFLLGGAVAVLASGGWWLHSRFFQPAVVPVDPHRIFNLPLSGDPPPPNRQDLPRLEYAWLPDSTHIAVATQYELFVANVQTGQIEWKRARSPATRNVLLLRWSADGKRIIAVEDDSVPGNSQIAWPGPYQSYSPQVSTWRGAFSPDETYLAYTAPNQSIDVWIWNIQERRVVAVCQDSETMTHPPGGNFAMAWSPDSTSLAVHIDWKKPAIQLWHVFNGHLLWTTDISHPADQRPGADTRWMKWSPDGLALAYASISDLVRLGVLDAQTGVIRFQTTMALSLVETIGEAFAWSPDGTRLAFFANERSEPVIQVWQAKTGQHLFTCQRVQGAVGLVPTEERNLYLGAPGIVSWSPDGKYLVARTLPDGKPAQAMLQFWDAQNGEALFSYHAPFEDDFLIWSPRLLWSPDSHFLAVYTVTSADCSVPGGYPGHPECVYTYALQVFQVG
jgi:WD40 repeat protein